MTKTQDAEQKTHGCVMILIVPRPDGWTPKTPTDLPPEFEQHVEHDAETAAAFVDGFNRAEMVECRGWWAIG